MIILDMGSGNTCKNDLNIIKKMIDAVADWSTDFILKWQLFENAPPNIPLDKGCFDYAYNYAAENGLRTTASVFDENSLSFLDTYNVPFIKIANNPALYSLTLKSIHHALISVPNCNIHYVADTLYAVIEMMCCVSKYPATMEEYEYRFPGYMLGVGLSDHTVGLELYKKYKPKYYEKHFVLEHDSANPDAGLFAITPKELKEL